VSKPQLQIYVDEFVFQHDRRKRPAAAFQTLHGLGTGRKSTEYDQIRGAKDLNSIRLEPLNQTKEILYCGVGTLKKVANCPIEGIVNGVASGYCSALVFAWSSVRFMDLHSLIAHQCCA